MPWPCRVHNGVRFRRESPPGGVVRVIHDIAVRIGCVGIDERALVVSVRHFQVATYKVSGLIHVANPPIGKAAPLQPGACQRGAKEPAKAGTILL